MPPRPGKRVGPATRRTGKDKRGHNETVSSEINLHTGKLEQQYTAYSPDGLFREKGKDRRKEQRRSGIPDRRRNP